MDITHTYDHNIISLEVNSKKKISKCTLLEREREKASRESTLILDYPFFFFFTLTCQFLDFFYALSVLCTLLNKTEDILFP